MWRSKDVEHEGTWRRRSLEKRGGRRRKKREKEDVCGEILTKERM